MCSNYQWYLDDGTVLEGDDAYLLLMNKQSQYRQLFNYLDQVIRSISELNHFSEHDDLLSDVLENSESLSQISLILEMAEDYINPLL